MITLERVRLVNWHNFDDTLIAIGNRCLFAGDNGSGKTTILDAIQYAMAADLRKARFNAAAGERKSGRDLLGYVRCKVGSDTTDYMRGDTVAHVMLEFSRTGGEVLSAGVCVEAYTDGNCNEHFWMGSLPIASLKVRTGQEQPLNFRQLKDSWAGAAAHANKKMETFESKKLYLREFTAAIGVWRRNIDYSPYLEAFTRSVSFTPMISVDRFVCDYILEEKPVEIQDMKNNLESYKEAEREAKGAVQRIEVLKKISAKAAEWRMYEGLILKQEYLMLRIHRDEELQKNQKEERKLSAAEEKLKSLEQKIAGLNESRFEWENELRKTDASLAANDAHILYMQIEDRINRLKKDLEIEEPKAERYHTLKTQCEAMLGRKLSENPAEDSSKIESEENQARSEKDAARIQKEEAALALREASAELAELERGLLRYPEAPASLKAALEKEGIAAAILADIADITNPDWVDAVEGWLSTRRFAILVDPKDFQKALEIYDRLPRHISGAFLPNLEKMRDAVERNPAQKNSLASLVETGSIYARHYIDFVLGNVICADIRSLKNFGSAVTRECMRYSGFTASRIDQNIYSRHYLGKAAQRERKEFLIAEKLRLQKVHEESTAKEQEAAQKEEGFRRVGRTLIDLSYLLPSVAATLKMRNDLSVAENELSAIDTRSFKELQEKRDSLAERIRVSGEGLQSCYKEQGSENQIIIDCRASMENIKTAIGDREHAIGLFAENHPFEISECEDYAEKQLSKENIYDLSSKYESNLKGYQTSVKNRRAEYADLVHNYDRDFHTYLPIDPGENDEAEKLLKRLETSELPEYREKIEKAKRDAEKEFKEHFISNLNENIEIARESFKEINEILRSLSFGRDQYRFALEEKSDRKGQIEIIKRTAAIPTMDDGLFSQINDPEEYKAVEMLFEKILTTDLDSPEMRSICDYRTYFQYDIKIRATDTIDQITGKPMDSSLSKVIREKSGGETQTPYYVAIAASFYRFFKDRPEETIRLVMFDEAFNRMDDERIIKILNFYKDLNIQLISAVPPEKIEAIAPQVDRTNLVVRHGYSARVWDFHGEAGKAKA
ncbi:ATP-binding protein [Leadbettera azotonutricia]|uniref:Putative MukB N-domain/M protein repeat protein n=1 Tax=Leadbettera azotonutricia (strain ATCC BAA-888 / DSM 13862 / ZAS-9) TaxID=545695 RepID=F5YBF1_LEAAZ|nr:SbcC/MukB-like Walker B domain-containing protein [Leadbettera azotonutricia]AEF80570.1 putative MukB N- domain/M protein repeat protein [Leadbettera azotonutricia ZAS-9]